MEERLTGWLPEAFSGQWRLKRQESLDHKMQQTAYYLTGGAGGLTSGNDLIRASCLKRLSWGPARKVELGAGQESGAGCRTG